MDAWLLGDPPSLRAAVSQLPGHSQLLGAAGSFLAPSSKPATQGEPLPWLL